MKSFEGHFSLFGTLLGSSRSTESERFQCIYFAIYLKITRRIVKIWVKSVCSKDFFRVFADFPAGKGFSVFKLYIWFNAARFCFLLYLVGWVFRFFLSNSEYKCNASLYCYEKKGILIFLYRLFEQLRFLRRSGFFFSCSFHRAFCWEQGWFQHQIIINAWSNIVSTYHPMSLFWDQTKSAYRCSERIIRWWSAKEPPWRLTTATSFELRIPDFFWVGWSVFTWWAGPFFLDEISLINPRCSQRIQNNCYFNNKDSYC